MFVDVIKQKTVILWAINFRCVVHGYLGVLMLCNLIKVNILILLATNNETRFRMKGGAVSHRDEFRACKRKTFVMPTVLTRNVRVV